MATIGLKKGVTVNEIGAAMVSFVVQHKKDSTKAG
jgi:hypothetical protein